MFSEDDEHCAAAATTDEMRAFQYGGGWNGASDARARGCWTNGDVWLERGANKRTAERRPFKVLFTLDEAGGRDGYNSEAIERREEGTGEWHQIGWKEIAQIIRRTSERAGERAR